MGVFKALNKAGMTITDARRRHINFSRSYFSNSRVLVVRRGEKVEELEELQEELKRRENAAYEAFQESLAEPGTTYKYSDLGMILLGEILSRVAGQPLEEFVRQRVFEPLGMENTMYRPGEELLPRIAPTEMTEWRGGLIHGEVHDGNAFAIGGIAPHAGLFATAGDLAVFAQMIMNGGVYEHQRIVSRETLALFTARADVADSTRALGWDTKSLEKSTAGRLFSESRCSPALVTIMALCPGRGHLVSQIPQPMQRASSTNGWRTCRLSPCSSNTSAFLNLIAFSGVGQCSSQTIQGIPLAKGKQRFLSNQAWPILNWCFWSISSTCIAPVGQTCPQRVQLNSQYPVRATR